MKWWSGMRRAGFRLWFVGLGACIGGIGDAASDVGEIPEVSPLPGGEPAVPGQSTPDRPRELLRLTPYQYVNTMRSLFPQVLLAQLADSYARIPASEVVGEMDRLDNAITSPHVRAYQTVANDVGAIIADDIEVRRQLDDCLGVPITPECAASFLGRFAPRVLRRPITGEELSELLAVYAVGADRRPSVGVGLAISALLQGPDFLFHLELGEPTAEGDYLLDPHELANRLAYSLTGGPPDAALIDASSDGLSETEFDEEVTRLIEGSAARSHFRHFVGQWFEFGRQLSLLDTPDIVRGDSDIDGLIDDAQREFLATVEHVVFDLEGGIPDLLTTNLSVLRSERLAAIYGVDVGTNADPVVTIPGERHAGILTRAAILLNDDGFEHPIHRGALVLRELTCDALTVPDVVDEDELELPDATTTRERWQNRTAGPVCQACHQKINPIGFALSNYDGLGRYREEETILHPETRRVVGSAPVDALVDISVSPGAEPVSVDGGAALGRLYAEEAAVHRCLAQRWVESSTGQRPMAGSRLVTELQEASLSGGVRSMVEAFVRSPGFRRRGEITMREEER